MSATKKQAKAETIRFKTKLSKIGSWVILKLPESASKRLTSRGPAMIKGKINGSAFQTALEPDGKGSHWFKLDSTMLKAVGVDAGDSVSLEIEQTNEWSEPKVPADLKKTLSSSAEIKKVWDDITPLARHEWVRWVGDTKNPQTRERRIDTAYSMLKKGKRRPCCFNNHKCTVPEISNNGVLLDVAL